ncbi:MAG: hypothetical protein C4293_05635 [Nitrospiraceae bacterium]
MSLERGSRTPTRAEVEGIARALGLRADALSRIAIDGWTPSPTLSDVRGVETIYGDIGGYAVKGYVLYDVDEAILIDTGYNPEAMLALLDKHGVRLTGICLTHGHTDHAGGLDRILKQRRVPVYLGADDLTLLSWTPPQNLLVLIDSHEDGRTIPVGRRKVRFMITPGHTPGGLCYRVEDGTQDLCFVGDTLFAGSIGRANPPSLYPAHLDSVRRRVLTLPEQTVLFPGHGPATTVREEVEHNPFAAAA